MGDSQNIFKKMISLITYKKNYSPEEFYIPENPEEPDKEKEENNQKTIKRHSDKKGKKRYKKPILLTEEKTHSRKETTKADDKVISNCISANVEYIRNKFNASTNKDLAIRYLTIAGKYKGFTCYLKGISDKNAINDYIIRPLLNFRQFGELIDENCLLDYIFESVIETNQTTKITSPSDAIYEILSGNTILYVESCSFYLSCETKAEIGRSVDNPQTEGSVIGAQEAFTESLLTNISLIRKLVKNNNLTTETFKLGSATQIHCAVMYMKGIVNPAIVQEVKRRIESIKTDYITGSGFLEQFIEDNSLSILPTILLTERPDKAALNIIEGRVLIMIDRMPFAQIVPVTATAFLSSAEDHILRWQYSTFTKVIRFFALFTAILLPGLYIAITNFHQEMIPTDLLIAIAKAKEQVPFPSLVEVLLMEVSFELIREAALRVPGIIGNTLGIIGALILGQAAVQANIVNPVLIIVVSVTGLSNFAIPNYNFAFGLRIMRFFFIIAGALLGLYGVTVMFTILLAWILSYKSFGVPYISPLFSRTGAASDLLIKRPDWKIEYRPDYLNPLSEKRQPHISRKWRLYNPATVHDKEGESDK